MNNIFERNINALRIKDEVLAQKLATHVLTDVPQLVHKNGLYNFLYKEKLLHNADNPLGEAKEIFHMATNEPVAIHLVYGLGLGYLFQVACANSKGTVILYEPDLNILRTAFTLVDFSADILKQNVFISTDYDKTSEYIYRNSNTKNSPQMLSTSGYRELDESGFRLLVEELQRQIGRYGLDLKFTTERFYILLIQTLDNIPNLVHDTPLIELKDLYKGKTAVVVSAGPTLDRNLETIKKNRDRIVVISVGTAVKALISNGIKPDFLCIIESFDCSKQTEGLDLSDVNFITEPFSHPYIRNQKYKKVYTHISSNLPVNYFWANTAGLNIEEYFSKGTVSYTALNTARILGCSKIVLVGQDLAYIEGQCYSKDSAYKDLYCSYNEETKRWEIKARDFDSFAKALSNAPDEESRKIAAFDRLKNLNSSLYYVTGINGEKIPTESVYAAFIKPLTEFTKKFPDAKYINTSLVGAQIDGFENMPLEAALKDAEPIEKIVDNIDFNYDILTIKDNLFKEKKNLQSAVYITEELLKICKNLKNDLNRYKTVNTDILKSLKKLSTGYLTLSSDYTKKNLLFDFITVSERVDLDYEMKMTREFNVESVTNIIDRIAKYCNTANERISFISGKIDQMINSI